MEVGKASYGISEAGRQWATVIEAWLLKEARFEHVLGVSQLFIGRDRKGSIALLLAELFNDLLISGPIQNTRDFLWSLTSGFA